MYSTGLSSSETASADKKTAASFIDEMQKKNAEDNRKYFATSPTGALVGTASFWGTGYYLRTKKHAGWGWVILGALVAGGIGTQVGNIIQKPE